MRTTHRSAGETRHFFYKLDDVFKKRIMRLMVKRKTTIDDLAAMVKKGFDHVDSKFDHTDSKIAYITETMADKASVNRRFDIVEKRFDHIDARISQTLCMSGRI